MRRGRRRRPTLRYATDLDWLYAHTSLFDLRQHPRQLLAWEWEWRALVFGKKYAMIYPSAGWTQSDVLASARWYVEQARAAHLGHRLPPRPHPYPRGALRVRTPHPWRL